MVLSLAIMGGTLGFLRYNTHPAMVFMGDTGSQFLGFSLGVLTIWLTQSSGAALAPELPLLILGLPVIDTLTVMTQRLLQGKSPFRPDRNHFHHKLLNLGFDHYEAVVAIYLIQTVFVVLAYLLRYESAWLILGCYALLALLVITSYPVAMECGWRLHRLANGQVSGFTGLLQRLRRAGWLPRLTYRLIALLILFFLLSGVTIRYPWSQDVSRYALAVVAVSVASAVLRLPYRGIFERLALYTLAILAAVAVSDLFTRELPDLGFLRQLYFVLLGGLIALSVQVSRGEFFDLTPSDYLVIAILLSAAFVPILKESDYTRIAVEAAVLLYGAEFILRKQGRVTLVLWLGSLAGLAVVSGRSLG
jgi:UDP-GlcNAc:undecaprenyl-phosphate GlcNAc-1-phosphate transferase